MAQPTSYVLRNPIQAQQNFYTYTPSYGGQYGPPQDSQFPTPHVAPQTSFPTYSAPTYTPPPYSPPPYTPTYSQPQPSMTDMVRVVTDTVRQEFRQEMSQLRQEVYQSQEQLYQSQQQTQQMCQELRDRVDYLSYVEDDRRSTTQHLFSLGGAFLGAAFGGPVLAVTTVVGAFGGSALGYVGGTAMHENSSGSVARREEIQASKKYLDILQTKV